VLLLSANAQVSTCISRKGRAPWLERGSVCVRHAAPFEWMYNLDMFLKHFAIRTIAKTMWTLLAVCQHGPAPSLIHT